MAPWLMFTVLPLSEIDAPWPLEMRIPESLMTSIAPVAVRSVMPAPPGTSESRTVRCPVVCSRMFGASGRPPRASGGTSEAEPYQQPVQIG